MTTPTIISSCTTGSLTGLINSYTMVYNYRSVAVMPSYRLLPIQGNLVEKKLEIKFSLDSPHLAVCLDDMSASRGHPFSHPHISNRKKKRKGIRETEMVAETR